MHPVKSSANSISRAIELRKAGGFCANDERGTATWSCRCAGAQRRRRVDGLRRRVISLEEMHPQALALKQALGELKEEDRECEGLWV